MPPKQTQLRKRAPHRPSSGLLFALAMALSLFIEGTLTIPGLCRALLGLCQHRGDVRAVFHGAKAGVGAGRAQGTVRALVSGFTAGLLSLCGGLLSLLVMWVLYHLPPVRPTWFILAKCGRAGSTTSASCCGRDHLVVALFYYAPVMLVLALGWAH